MQASIAAVFLAIPEGQAGFDLWKMITGQGPINFAVFVLLLLMSMWSFGVILDRALMYAAARKHSRLFVRQVAGALRDGNLEEALLIAERHGKSHIAKVTASGLAEFHTASPRISEGKLLESAQRTLGRSQAIVHGEMERGLASLATIGSTAPFVGLFGTVVGILRSFQIIAVQKSPSFTAVSAGISEALIATALGLLVAIPAVWGFNAFTNKLKSFGVEMDNSSMELINYFVARMEERRHAAQ